MHYVWQHRLWKSGPMATNDGRRVRVIDPGLLNTDAGPDFFNAKIEIDGHIWVGNVEMHIRASDWHRHGHDTDPAYDSVILHVVQKDDAPVRRLSGERIPQMVLEVSPRLSERLDDLVGARTELPCAARLRSVEPIVVTDWIQALAFERIHSKAARLLELYSQYAGNWEEICYISLARTLGFGINGDALERLARRTPLRLLHKHSDSRLQVEALLFGQAGMLADNRSGDAYCGQLAREYAFLANKFSLQPLDGSIWKLFRIRPQNFPYRRIALLAQYVEGGFSLSQRILETETEEQLRDLFQVELTGYWEHRFTFGNEVSASARALSPASVDIVLINTVVPLLCARAEVTGDYALRDRAVDLLESLRPERNAVVALFTSSGIKCSSALDSQALIQLKRNYCEARKCIYCRFGHKLLSSSL